LESRHSDGSAGDANYGLIGVQYAQYRQPDRRIAEYIGNALAKARTVLNVGAGAGSYEPTDRLVTAVEPSAAMRAQRPAHLSQAIDAVAERLPFDDRSFEASMATFTVHQWRDLHAGLQEMRRVTRDAILILTCDPSELDRFWLNEYAPEAIAVEARRYPLIKDIVGALGAHTQVLAVPIPFDCVDGFGEAYYGRPERLLEAPVRKACSAWSFVEPAAIDRFETRLRSDLESGSWDAKFGHLRTQPQFEGSLRLIVGRP
jgi:SAM-dependent methyltransferase